MNIEGKLRLLRDKMLDEGIDAYLIPSSDPHQSEYLPKKWQIMRWISGFTGSAGTVLLTQDHAGLWTDSRYFIQAENQLSDSSFVLHKHIKRTNPSYIDWIVENLDANAKVGVDGILFSVGQIAAYEKKLKPHNIQLEFLDDFITGVWSDRKGNTPNEIFEHEIKYAGKSRIEKIKEIRKGMDEYKVDHHLISKLDDIAWTFNLRGTDVKCNPVFISYAIVSKTAVTLFVNKEKIPEQVLQRLRKDKIDIQPYNSLKKFLHVISAHEKILINKASTSYEINAEIPDEQIVYGKNIPMILKAIKNKTELNHIEKSMVADGIALTHAFYWLEHTIKDRRISECEFALKLAECRAGQEDYYGESFDAIVGYEGNGAIIHYKPEPKTCAEMQNKGILLCDSGGQYYYGTTDITRTISFDHPTEKYKKAYTLVLKGHIALAKAKFPKGTSGGQLDMLARKSLWDHGMNYGHGTGHGVGFFLNVHEPPQSFSPSISLNALNAQKAGMLTSNEPGYYEEGEFGIRIENLVVTNQCKEEGFLEFETVTLFPIETSTINRSLMESGEIEWLNNYHKKVFQKLSPHLNEKHNNWLREKCSAI